MEGNVKRSIEDVSGNGGTADIKPKLQGESLVLAPLAIERKFTRFAKSPFEYDIYGNPINWVSEDVSVMDDAGKPIYVQPGVKKPGFWSSLALKVVASKYFWGNMQKGERENSAEQLIRRVSDFYERQAIIQKYFDKEQATILKEEIAAICLNQFAVFNSPVWF